MTEFFTVGKQTNHIEVTISYRIIQLFSEGLYASPNKAVEELVCNGFDANARNVHVILSPDLQSTDASIVIIDDGESMDYAGLKEHWIIGRSSKSSSSKRKKIGKFGIGKLATYVLANRLTHFCKKDGKFYSVSMDYRNIPSDTNSGVFGKSPEEEKVVLPFRELTEAEAEQALAAWTQGSKKGYKSLKLFGREAPQNWTVAIMSDLKRDMIATLKPGRLKWVLSTAMPLRDDFKVYLNGDEIEPDKLKGEHKTWIVGKDITEAEIDKVGIDDLIANEDEAVHKKNPYRFGLASPRIGRICGYLELYDDRLDTGKSYELVGRSNGFFVYVMGRLINEDDGHFGIGSNELSHGTFSRFRAVLYADKLNDELRSSRETVREGALVQDFRNILKSIFNIARREWTRKELEAEPGAKFSNTIKLTPDSLIQRPLLNLISSALDGRISPKYVIYPTYLTEKTKPAYLELLQDKISQHEGLVKKSELTELGQDDRLAVLDISTGILSINSMHPFVAHFLDEYEDVKKNLPLELLAMSEVLLEANLYQSGLEHSMVISILDWRDELLRTLAKSTTKRNAFLIAQALLESATNAKTLETELVAVFNSMGFDAIPIGGNGKPDGTATAVLGLDVNGKPQRYMVSLEAKSKAKENTKVSNSSVRVSAIARQRDDYFCDHALVVGPDFPGEDTVLAQEIDRDRDKTEKTITVMRINDLARLVRLRPLKRLGPADIRELFKKCRMPDECKAWVDAVEQKEVAVPKYKDILQVIWDRHNDRPNEPVEYGVVAYGLETKLIRYSRAYIIICCTSLEGMAPECICCRGDTVELRQKPEIVLERIKTEIQKCPETGSEQSFLKGL